MTAYSFNNHNLSLRVYCVLDQNCTAGALPELPLELVNVLERLSEQQPTV